MKIPKARLDMTSLMDVMFLVLVFFVYSIFDMSVHRGLKVDLPSAAGVHERGERIVVTIAADDALQVNGRAVTRDEIVVAAKRLPGVPVLISGDRKASLGTGIEILAALKAAGVEHVSFQVDGKSE